MEKSELISYRALLREVRQLRTALECLEASIYSPRGQKFTAMPHAPAGHGVTMADVVCRHMELEELYLAKLAELNGRRLEIEAAIGSLQPEERLVMRHRYLEGHSWAKICADLAPLGYSERTIYRLHGMALLKLRDR